jgi:MtaA/CmuA family methyltransferase
MPPARSEGAVAVPGIMNDLRRCCAGGTPARVPFFPLGVMYDFHVQGFTHRQWRTDPAVMLQVGTGAVEMFDVDVYMLHPDDLIEYEEMGIGVTDLEDLPPAVSSYLPATEETLRGLRRPADLGMRGRLARHLEGLRALKRILGDTVCLSGRIAAPFTTVSLILGVQEALLLMLEQPDLLRRYMDFFLDYNDEVARLQQEAGADAIWLGDCVGTSHFISAAQYGQFAGGPAAESARRIRGRGGICLYHGAEISIPHLQVMAGLGFDAINIGYGVDIAEVKKAIGARVCIMGNLDTIRVLRPLSAGEVTAEVSRMVEAAMTGGGYIFCTGEGITHDTPRANVTAMLRAVRAHGGYTGR